jgi:hypothetical protein
MKKIKTLKKILVNSPTNRLVLYLGLMPSIGFVALYQFVLIEIPGTNFLYKVGLLFNGIFNSIIAASFFYFISQYISVDLPEKRIKIKTISLLHQYYYTINEIIMQITIDIGYENMDIKNLDTLSKVLEKIDVDSPIYEFPNWYKYFYHKKLQLMELTRSSFYFHKYLEENITQELLIIDKNLMNTHLFSGYKILVNENLSFGAIQLQEIFIHNSHLKQYVENERTKYSKELTAEGVRYREEHYS